MPLAGCAIGDDHHTHVAGAPPHHVSRRRIQARQTVRTPHPSVLRDFGSAGKFIATVS